MPNITVSVPDDVYRAARISAAERGSSVSALVAEFLGSLTEREADFARREDLWQEVRSQIKGFSARDNLSRDELYDRAALRAAEHERAVR